MWFTFSLVLAASRFMEIDFHRLEERYLDRASWRSYEWNALPRLCDYLPYTQFDRVERDSRYLEKSNNSQYYSLTNKSSHKSTLCCFITKRQSSLNNHSTPLRVENAITRFAIRSNTSLYFSRHSFGPILHRYDLIIHSSSTRHTLDPLWNPRV